VVVALHHGTIVASCRAGRAVGFTLRRRGRFQPYEEMVACASLAHLWLAGGWRSPAAGHALLLFISGRDVVSPGRLEEAPEIAAECGSVRRAALPRP
jgi:hypothetical protein